MIYLQRHTHPNIAPHICYGVSDIPLMPNYREHHLPRVIEQLKGISVDRLYSSPLTRCRTLAMDIYTIVGAKEVVIDDRLMEVNFGDWEMRPWDEIHHSAHGKLWFENYLTARPPHGESFMDMVARATSFLEESDKGDVMLVTHSGFMRAALVARGKAKAEEVFNIEIHYGDMITI